MRPETSTDERRVALEAWLNGVFGGPPDRIAPASADASFRRYFRIWRGGATAIVMDAPPDREDLAPYLRVAEILAAAGVNVPRVLERELSRGFLLLTDLGSRQYLDALRAGEDPDRLYEDALAALVQAQARGTPLAAGLPLYDASRLRQEMALFPEWFLQRHLGIEMTGEERSWVEDAFEFLIRAALAQPRVLVHRDYHSRNLMVCDDNPGVLDFQDAVTGAPTYDLVSLLKDCYVRWPRERVLGWLDHYRACAGAAGISVPAGRESFIESFDLMGLQRHLKVLGIFARLWHRDGKPGYLADLPRVLDYTLEVTGHVPAFARLDRFLRARVEPALVAAQAREVTPT
jgi:hypothetical protein